MRRANLIARLEKASRSPSGLQLPPPFGITSPIVPIRIGKIESGTLALAILLIVLWPCLNQVVTMVTDYL